MGRSSGNNRSIFAEEARRLKACLLRTIEKYV
jgi:hypothetical protein